jgi:hypothetical protein
MNARCERIAIRERLLSAVLFSALTACFWRRLRLLRLLLFCLFLSLTRAYTPGEKPHRRADRRPLSSIAGDRPNESAASCSARGTFHLSRQPMLPLQYVLSPLGRQLLLLPGLLARMKRISTGRAYGPGVKVCRADGSSGKIIHQTKGPRGLRRSEGTTATAQPTISKSMKNNHPNSEAHPQIYG